MSRRAGHRLAPHEDVLFVNLKTAMFYGPGLRKPYTSLALLWCGTDVRLSSVVPLLLG